MRRKDKHTINMRTNQLIRSLMKNPGDYFHVSNYHCTNATRRDLFERVTNTLKLMGIKHQIQKGTFKIRVLNDEQILEYASLKTGVFIVREHKVKLDEVF